MRKRRDLGQPSDIAFLLIIFFLLLAGINTTQSISLHSDTRDSPQTDYVTLQALLTQQGTILLDDQFYSPFEFALKLHPDTTLHLQVEEETSWQQVVDLLSLTEQRQIAGLSLTLADRTRTAIASQGEGRNLATQQQEPFDQEATLLEKENEETTKEKTREMAP